MNGPQHFAEAERLAVFWADSDDEWSAKFGADMLAAAQVHATLALVAATMNAADTVTTPCRDRTTRTAPMDLDCAAPMWDEVLA